AVPRIILTLEHNERAPHRRYLDDIVIDVAPVSQKSQPAALWRPIGGVEIKKAGNNLVFTVGMNSSVALMALPTNGNHQWAFGKLDAEFFCDCVAKLERPDVGDKPLERRPEFEFVDRVEAGRLELWEIRVDV